MSAIKDIKKELTNKLSAISSVNKVYDYEKLNPAGFPAVFCTFVGSDNQFVSTAENERVHSYRILVLCQIGQSRDNLDQAEKAEQQSQDIIGDILNAFDSDYTLSGAVEVIYTEAAVGQSGYVQYEGGWARSAEVTLKVHSLYLV